MRNTGDFENRYTSPEGRETQEGAIAKSIESETAKLPSDLFLWIAGGAIAASLALRILG
jgi:hypothetical protein